ncbi:hypothetical protein MUK42_11033 [Musa troglodytarum]|uniref:Methyltransferase type 11 domain-containing protein n=2 Tax=Musa troglodytarum TaxID=320322 RepID=A0A9E7GR02_9LILI|nr:hypothetical protein MUK42_11033 [Musa troglodytarum]
MEMEMEMEKKVERLLNRVSLFFAAIATLALLHLFAHSSLSCAPAPLPTAPRARGDGRSQPQKPKPAPSSPRSSCDAASREVLTPDKRFAKLRSSRSWRRRADAYAALFASLRSPTLLSNASHVLCVSAGAGHEVAALQESGVSDVTGVDLVDFPPLVRRADPHNLPFFDDVFDIAFTAGLAGALFPARFVAELERTVRRGGAVVLAVDRPSSAQEAEGIKALFRRSSLLEARNTTMLGSEMSLFIMKNNGKKRS